MSTKRPQQNSNGSPKGRSSNPDGQAALPSGPGRPNLAPNHALKSNLAPAMPGAVAGPQDHPPLPPMTAGGTGGDLGMLQTRVNFRDMPPVAQAQTEQQMGIDPYAMLKMGQQDVNAATQQAQAGNQPQGLAPNALSGPGIPQEAQLDNFPHDLNALMQTMHAGYSPGADAASLGQAQNAHAIARAMSITAQQNAQNMGAHQDATTALAALMQKLHLLGHLPPPEAVANHVINTAPPQLAGAMMGGAQPGAPVVNG